MNLDKISKEIYSVFKSKGWSWGEGDPSSYIDIKDVILELIDNINKYEKESDKVMNWITSGRIRVLKENSEYTVLIDGLWEINNDDLMVEKL